MESVRFPQHGKVIHNIGTVYVCAYDSSALDVLVAMDEGMMLASTSKM